MDVSLLRRLVPWIGVGMLLAAITVVVGIQDGAVAGWSLGAILATVYSGTFAFIKPTLIKKGHEKDNRGINGEKEGIEMDPSRPNGRDILPGGPQGNAANSLSPWQKTGEGTSYSWHPALNRIEDVLVAQVTDLSTIMGIAERMGMNPGTIPVGQGTAATLWHGVLRHAWMMGHERKICDILHDVNNKQPSQELQDLIRTCCGQWW